jgi:alkylation response protein AidB-like acyl-CoA dehydrogenase
MDFELTQEQKMFKDLARKFAEQEILPSLREYEKEGKLHRENIRKLGALGLIGTHIPQDYGGLGLDYVTCAVIWEQVAWGSYAQALAAFGPSTFGGTILMTFGSESLKKTYLPPVCSGERLMATCGVEPNAGSDAAATQTQAVADGDYWVINGNKTWTTNLAVADYMVVLAQTDKSKGVKGFASFLIDRDQSSGISQTHLEAVGDRSGNVGQARFQDTRVPKQNLIGEIGKGLNNTLHGIGVARLFVAAGALGIAQSCLDSSIKYVKERHQFGRPIGQFQLVQEEIARMAAEIEAVRWQVYYGTFLMDKHLPYAKEVSAAKLLASELAVKVSASAVHVHGAYGCSEDYPIAHHYRDAILAVVSAGTNGMQKLIIGRELLGISAFV